MSRGVSFRVSQKATDNLRKILSPINPLDYYWHNVGSQQEAWSDRYNNVALFSKENYSGEEFLACIEKEHFILSLKIEAYRNRQEFDYIRTYEDFLISDCLILLLIYDCEFVQVYAKDQCVIEQLVKNAIAYKFSEVEYITDENDGRTIMDIL